MNDQEQESLKGGMAQIINAVDVVMRELLEGASPDRVGEMLAEANANQKAQRAMISCLTYALAGAVTALAEIQHRTPTEYWAHVVAVQLKALATMDLSEEP